MDLINVTNSNSITKQTDNLKAFNILLDYITNTNLEKYDSSFKWKTYANQVVIKSDKYFYKIYIDIYNNGYFNLRIREELAKIYREDYGLHWDIKCFNDGLDYFYQIQQKEILTVVPDEVDFKIIFKDWKEILDKLEERLNFRLLEKQLKHQIPNLSKIKLLRTSYNTNEDYAYTKNGKIVLLDDADFILVFLDKNNDIMTLIGNVYEVIFDKKECYVVPNTNDGESISNMFIKHFSQYRIQLPDRTLRKAKKINFLNFNEKLLRNNVKFLCGDSEVELFNTESHIDERLLLE